VRVIVANSVEDIVKKGCFYIIYVLVKRAYEALYLLRGTTYTIIILQPCPCF